MITRICITLSACMHFTNGIEMLAVLMHCPQVFFIALKDNSHPMRNWQSEGLQDAERQNWKSASQEPHSIRSVLCFRVVYIDLGTALSSNSLPSWSC